MDTNKDGVVSPDERAAAKRKRAQAQHERSSDARDARPHFSPEQKRRILQRFDADGDGRLSDEERAHARAARANHGA